MRAVFSLFCATLIFLFLVSCTKPWKSARTALEITNEAAMQTDGILAKAQQPALDKAQARVEKAYKAELLEFRLCREATPHVVDCPDPGTPEAYTAAHYDTDERVVNWGRVAGGVESIKATLITADEVVTAWKATKEEPQNWTQICDAVHEAANQTTNALVALKIDVPVAWNQGRGLLAPLCRWIGGEVTSGDKRKVEVL